VKTIRPTCLLCCILLSGAHFVAGAPVVEPERLPIFESGMASVELASQIFTVSYSVSVAGPLVALQPIVVHLGGELHIGPLGQSHELTVGEATYVFGPDSSVVTHGEEITALTQRPLPAIDGLQIPLDLLATIYGENQNRDFRWDAASKRLVVSRLPEREVPVEGDLVHLQGVTTIVFEFPFQPRYRITRTADGVDIELTGDRFRLDTPQSLASDRLVQDVLLSPERIRLILAPGAEAEDYVLRRPFRLVFDVYRAAPTRSTGRTVPTRPRRSNGLRTVVVDPGHGGSDTGAVGPSGSAEKDLTLTLARTLRRQLLRRMPVKVVLTRDEDVELPPDTRAALANQQKADRFISLHLNSIQGDNASGAESGRESLGQRRPTLRLAAHSVGPCPEPSPGCQPAAGRAHTGRAQPGAGLAQPRGEAGPVPGSAGSRHAGGSRRARLPEQPQ
jgi:N-acetylmuramoyl-L-alanine amidase